MKEFSKWTIEEVEDTFQLTQVDTLPLLTAWESAEVLMTPEEEAQLRVLADRLRRAVHDWNEEELKLKFIGLLILLADYDQADYRAFFERPIAVKVNHERLAGVVDCIVSAGKRSPKRPFFCLHEYKPEKRASDDPMGQTVIALVAAQKLNDDGQPLYGAYVVGRNWYFVVLADKEFVVSKEYDATQEADLRQIFRMLKQIKTLLEARLTTGTREHDGQTA